MAAPARAGRRRRSGRPARRPCPRSVASIRRAAWRCRARRTPSSACVSRASRSLSCMNVHRVSPLLSRLRHSMSASPHVLRRVASCTAVAATSGASRPGRQPTRGRTPCRAPRPPTAAAGPAARAAPGGGRGRGPPAGTSGRGPSPSGRPPTRRPCARAPRLDQAAQDGGRHERAALRQVAHQLDGLVGEGAGHRLARGCARRPAGTAGRTTRSVRAMAPQRVVGRTSSRAEGGHHQHVGALGARARRCQ